MLFKSCSNLYTVFNKGMDKIREDHLHINEKSEDNNENTVNYTMHRKPLDRNVRTKMWRN